MQKIYSTELEYIKCFSEYYEDKLIVRFTDSMIADMYSHNLTYIKRDVSDDLFQDLIQSEILQSIKLGRDFLNIQFDFPYRASLVDQLDKKPSEITLYGYYEFPIVNFDKLQGREDCSIKKLDSTLLDEASKLDLSANGEGSGRDFTERRFERRSKVYLQSGMVDRYICFHNDEAVGHCDLYLNGNVAKIEDFDVPSDKQRRGYGTALLKEIIRIAISNNAEIIYLITDDSDTAKDMYTKCGFSKVGEKSEMLFEI